MSLIAVAVAVAAASVPDSASPTGSLGGLAASAPAEIGSGEVDAAVEPYVAPEHLEAVTVGPEDVSEPVRMVLASARLTTALDESGIPDVALQAYRGAATVTAGSDTACGLRWSLLAAIGRVESNHGRFGGSLLLMDGYGTRPIRGIPLDGRPNVALIRDTDEGRLDGDTSFDRAVGPMQFIPTTWASVGVDANGDGNRDPDNIFDAALGAAAYLCAADGDLTDPGQAASAVRRYNNADEYVRVVLALAASYERGEADIVSTAVSTSTDSSGSAVSGQSQEGQPNDSPHAPPASTDDAPHPVNPMPVPTPELMPVPMPVPTPGPTPESTPESTTPTASMPAVEPTQKPERPTPEWSGPAAGPTTSAAPTQVPEAAEQPEPTPSPELPDVPPSSATPASDDAAAIGWAPAMREVVVGLLAGSAGDAKATGTAATMGPDPADKREELAEERLPGR